MAKKPTYEELEQRVKELEKQVSERERAEEALQASEEKFRALSEAAFETIFLSEKGICLGQNLTAEKMFGYTPSEAIGRPGTDWIAPEFREMVRNNMLSGYERPYEAIALRKDGSTFPVEIQGKMICYQDREIRVTSLCDITDRVLAEKALRESEERYRTLVETITDMVFIISPNGNFTYLNPAFEKLTGYPVRDFIGHSFTEILAPEYIESTVDRFKRGLSGETIPIYEVALKHKDGKTAPIELNVTSLLDADGKSIGRIGVARDIADRRKAEEALRQEKGFTESLIDTAQAIILVLDTKGRIIRFNAYMEDLSGYKLEEVQGRDWFSTFLPEQDYDRISELFRAAVSDIQTRGNINPIVAKDGHEIIVEWHDRTLKDADGNTIGLLATGQDITARKQAEGALRESEDKFRNFAEQSLVGIYLISDDVFKYVNPKFAEIFGYSVDECLDNMHFPQLVHPEDSATVKKQVGRRLTGETKTVRYSFRGIKKNGETIHVEIFGASMLLKGKTAATGTMLDITDRIQAEEEREQLQDKLHRAQKMEAMGLMAGGIAHDLNNILSGIVSYPELLLMDLPEDSPLRNPIKTIQESGIRAADVVEDLLTIARGVASGKEVLNLNTLITEYLGSAEHHKLEKIHPLSTIKTELNSELLNITGSASHVKKILMNLVTNSSEAIEGKGTVTISTINRYLDEPLKGYEDVHIGEYVVLTISDDGSGISPGDIERIFEPFYTKKMMGRSGTGLGLAVVWNTVQDHNGYINVKSSEKGTEFELYFPVTREEVAAEEEEVPVAEYQGHGEKILVVDDEEKQREIASGILNRLGYTAEAVSSGEEAIEYVEKHPVDLIVLDMVMPKGINGRETYEEIIKIRPGQKAIIASGYAKTKEVDLAQELGAGKYIKKPYTLAKVGVAVKEELAR